MMEMAFDKPFEEQLEFFRRKGFKLSPESWRDVWKGAHARSFTVARVTAMDVLVDIRKALDKAMAEGVPLKAFKKDLSKTLERRGWLVPTGEKAIQILPDGSERKRLTGWRLRTIYQTNMAASYHVGRYKQMEAVKDARPFWQYRSQRDPSVREAHRFLDGKVYHADHPFWDNWYPPNGFNCRCYVKTLSERQMNVRGLTEEKKGVSKKPNEGWDYNVGEAGLDHWKPDLDKKPTLLKQQYLESLIDNVCPDDWADFAESKCHAKLKKRLTQSDLEDLQTLIWARKQGGVEGYPEWVNAVAKRKHARGELYPVGNLPDFVCDRVTPRLALVILADKELVHLYRETKRLELRAATLREIRRMPLRFYKSDWFIDHAKPGLLMCWRRVGTLWLKTVIKTDQKIARGVIGNRISTMGIVEGRHLEARKYEKL